MKKHSLIRFLSIILVPFMIIAVIPVTTARAQTVALSEPENGSKLLNLHGDQIFILQTAEKVATVSLSANKNTLAISLKYPSAPNCVYQYVYKDFQGALNSVNSPSFWLDAIKYAEERRSEATKVIFTYEKVTIDGPTAYSSAGADLLAELEGYVGEAYSDQYTGQYKVRGGNTYKLYETLELNVRDVTRLTWNAAITVSSLITGVIGLVATSGTVNTICGILGLAVTAADALIPPGKMNEYECMAYYTRYIRVDDGTRQYAHAYKIRTYKGFEDASDNSKGRAHIIADSELEYYSGTQTAEYYNSGLFDEAYDAYHNIGV